MGILIGVLVVAALALGWWAISDSLSGNHVADEKERWVATEHEQDKAPARPLPAWALGLIIASVLFGIGIIVLQILGFGDNPVLGDAVANVRPM